MAVHRSPLRCLMIAMLAFPTGKPDGQLRKKLGAALVLIVPAEEPMTVNLGYRAGILLGRRLRRSGVVQIKSADVSLLHLHCRMTAMRGSPTGNLAGQRVRWPGAARTPIAAASLMTVTLVFTAGAHPGLVQKRRGAVSTGIVVARPQLQHRLCHLIAMLASKTGMKGGRRRKNIGAVHMQAVAAPLNPAFLSIVMPAIQIGKQAGRKARKFGAVPMCAKAVRPHERNIVKILDMNLSTLFSLG